MKYIKLFEDFSDLGINDINTRLEKIKSMLPSKFDFEWELETEDIKGKEQGFLFIHLYLTQTNLRLHWNIDLDKPHIKFIAEGKDVNGVDVSNKSYTLDVSDITEALDMVEKEINKITTEI